MDLRRRTTQGLAAAGALLIVAGLSLGSGVALAEPGPAAAGPPEAVQATNTSSDKSSDKPRKKDRKSRKSTNTTSADSTDSNSTDSGSTDSGSADSGSTDSGSSGSTGSTATTTPPSTASTATTATTSTTRPTTTSAPATTATTSASSSGANTSTDTGSADSTPNGSGGTYDGQPITATEDDSTTTTIDDGRGSTPAPARKPAARGGSGSGSDLPPGIYPVDPGPGGARTANSPASNSTPAPAAVPANPPIVVTETQPAQQTTSSTAAPGTADGNTATSPGGEVRGANQVQEEAPAPARRGRQLGQTGDGTRRLILFGGVALLIGAVVVGFTGRDGPILAAAAALPAGPVRRRSTAKRRKQLDGWEKGIPLAPAKRELARQQLGLSAAVWYYDDGPEA